MDYINSRVENFSLYYTLNVCSNVSNEVEKETDKIPKHHPICNKNNILKKNVRIFGILYLFFNICPLRSRTLLFSYFFLLPL